jgi:hypothetical protein
VTGTHTPGPWEAVLSRDTQWRIWSRAYAEEEVLVVPWDPRAEENARLMAAAPDLLEACQTMLAFFGPEEQHQNAATLRRALDGARTAVAKATGEAER